MTKRLILPLAWRLRWPKTASRACEEDEKRVSGSIALAKPRRIKAVHRRRRKIASGQSVQRYYDPLIGRFLSVDPVTANPNTGASFNRYAYVSNNPYKFKDPDGRYECQASKDQCKTVSKAVKDIASAARNSVAGGTRIPKISHFLGTEGRKNGVVITAGGDKSLGSARTENGVTTLKVDFKGANSTDKVSSVITHEASHGLDQRAREKRRLDPMTRSRSELNVSEINANYSEASLFKALDRDSPYGMWTREGGVNHEKVNSDADRSVNSVCSQMVCDP